MNQTNTEMMKHKLFRTIAVGVLALLVCAAMAQAESPEGPILFTNVNVFDGVSEKLIRNANVVVTGNIITAVSTEDLAVAGGRVIDGGGRTLMPGLIDAHYHTMFAAIPLATFLTAQEGYINLVAAKNAEQLLLQGFTTVRDVAGNSFSLRRAIEEGLSVGPRIFPSGSFISQTSGHGDFRPYNAVPTEATTPSVYTERNAHTRIADGVPEVLRAVRENLRMGATQIKMAAGGGVSSIYDPLDVTEYTFEEFKAAVDAAASWNTYVMTHVFTDAGVKLAISAGVKSIEHGLLMSEETLRMMKEKDVWLSIQPILNDEDAIPFPDPVSQAKFVEATKGTEKVYPLARDIGVKMAFGTDALFDAELAKRGGKQLAKLQRWFTPAQVLKMATHDNAQLLKLSGPRNPYQAGELGAVAEGAYADLILVDGNPLENLDLIADPANNFVVIMKDGKIYKNTLQ